MLVERFMIIGESLLCRGGTMLESPLPLVAILVASKRTGDRDLERTARFELEERFGMKIAFTRDGVIQRESENITKGKSE